MKRVLLLYILTFSLSFTFAGEKGNITRLLPLAISYHNAGRYIDALELYEKCLEIQPWNQNIELNISRVKYMLNDMSGFCKHINSLDVVPKPIQFHNSMYCSHAPSKNKYKKDLFKQKGLTADNGYQPVYDSQDSMRGALRFERTCFDVTFYDLAVKIDDKNKFIEGQNTIHFKVIENTNRIQLDLFENYIISSVLFNGDSLKIERLGQAFFVNFREELIAQNDYKVEVIYSGHPRVAPDPPWDGGFVWDKTKGSKLWAGVACEQLGASVWWPNKDHLTDEPDSMRLKFACRSPYQVISNGNLRKVTPIEDDYLEYEWFVSNPIDNYNVTFYIGKFVNFHHDYTNDDGQYRIDYYVLNKNLSKAKEFYIKTPEIVGFFEEFFGTYPYWSDGMAMVESPFLGMEHQGAIAIGGDYGNTTRDWFRNTEYDYLVVHETAHEWWGNSVSIGDMADGWLQEGFATYAEYLLIENKIGADEYIYELSKSMNTVLNIWPMVGARDVNDNTFVGNDIYTKGALVLHNLRVSLGDDSLFFKIIKNFAEIYKGSIVNTQNFIDLVNETSGKDFTAFFDKFLLDTELPVLEYRQEKVRDKITFYYKWNNVKDGFFMPFTLVDNKGVFHQKMATTKEQSFSISGVKYFNFVNEWTIPDNTQINHLVYFDTEYVFQEE